MKKHLLIILCVFALGILTGCFENSSSVDGDSGNVITTGIETVSDTNSIIWKDTIWYEVNAKANYSYIAKLKYSKRDYVLRSLIISPNNDKTLDSSFRANEDGTYRVGVCVAYASVEATKPYSFSISINEFPSISNRFSGKWILVKEKGTAFGESSEFSYSTENASEVIEFYNDSIVEYTFNSYDNELKVFEYLFASSYKGKFDYSFSGNSLILSSTNKNGSSAYHYEKFEGEISSLKWAAENFKAPSEFIGTWFLSQEKLRVAWFENGEYKDLESSYESSLGKNSKEILVISEDSVMKYERFGFSVDTFKSSINEHYHFLSKANLEGTILTRAKYGSRAWINDNTDNYESWADIESYTKYSGSTPPLEWYEINMPATQIELPIKEEQSAVISPNDTLWYKIKVEKDTTYDIVLSDTDTEYGYMSGFVLDEDTTQITNVFGTSGWYDFKAKTTGTYYIAVLFDDVIDTGKSCKYSISYDVYAGNGMATAAPEKRNERERRGRRGKLTVQR